MTSAKSILRFLVVALIFLGLGAALPIFLEKIYGASHFMYIPQTAGKYIVAVLWSLFIAIIVQFAPINSKDKSTLLIMWGLRTGVTLGFMIFYERSYNLDAYIYYKHAMFGEFYSSWFEANGSERVTYLLWFINKTLPTFDSYHALKVLWSIMGIFGGYVFYRGYLKHNEPNQWVLAALCACPSILFWSSIIGKDPLVFFGISVIAYSSLRCLKGMDFIGIAGLAFGLVTAGMIRIWLVPIFLIPLILKMTLHTKKFNAFYFARTAFLFGTLYFAFGYFIQTMDLNNFQDSFDRLNTISRGWAHGGSGQEVPEFNSPKDVLLFMPQASFTAIFRPLPGEINNMFGILAGFENLGFLLLFAWSLFYFISHYARLKTNPQFTYYLLTLMTWSSVYGILSYQNLGTAVRFKLQIVPFLIMFSAAAIERYQQSLKKEDL